MSQEQPPVRSRRELRQARDEQKATGSTGPGQVSPASKQPPSRPAESPNELQAQRSSQIRARDRATLRTLKELEEKEEQLAAGGPPTRRQRRLQQLKEQAVTSANPIVPPAPDKAPDSPRDAAAQAVPVQPAPSQPAPSQPLASQPAPSSSASSSRGAGIPDGISVEQALAARSLIAEQAKNQLAKMEHIASLDPEAVDPDILAEQIALAERAAVLNRRAMAKQKLAEQAAPQTSASQTPAPQTSSMQASTPAAQPAVSRPAPSATSNLAMVTPLEFVQVPGVDRPVMKPPATSYVPVVTNPGPRLQPSNGKGRKPSTSASPAGTGPSAAASGRSGVIARAEAAARAARSRPAVSVPASRPASTPAGNLDDLFDDHPRIPARSAHGLEPLDAATAGLARAKRMRLVQFAVLAFGIVALISGIILIISGITR
ncbi:hypothetical protein F8G81_14190 [Arthrobacter sp. CDRTa11]|uniref:hypothetical protein n=1 Tax=Arthrobacter sp. CDRTa11 TaxID=2651199 RepID=UPI002265AFB8|nr:hypothetical protein [Arthrobacter sp. CDRTa11]UZX03632.1 hypothetical protein F8G81_14190 [Arthrobacter sp. CDRTa11]